MKKDTKGNLTVAFIAAALIGTLVSLPERDIRPLSIDGIPDGCRMISGGRMPAMACE